MKRILQRVLRPRFVESEDELDKENKIRKMLTVLRVPDTATSRVIMNVYGCRRNVDERFHKLVMESVCKVLDSVLIPDLNLTIKERDLDGFFRVANLTNNIVGSNIDNISNGIVSGVNDIIADHARSQPEHIASIINRVLNRLEIDVEEIDGPPPRTFFQ